MAISFVGVATGTTATSTAITLPGTPAEDDLVIVVVGSQGGMAADGFAAPDFSGVEYRQITTAGNNPGLSLWYKYMGSTPDGSVDLNANTDLGGLEDTIGIVWVFRGVHTTTGIVYAPSATGASGCTKSTDSRQAQTLYRSNT